MHTKPYSLFCLAIFFSLIAAACGSASSEAAPTAPPSPSEVPSQAPAETPDGSPPISAPDYQVIYDFQELYCQAEWKNNSHSLPCPSNPGQGGGSVSIAYESDMESLVLTGDSALLTYPAHDGMARGIFGIYPPITLQEHDQFRATIGCLGVTTAGDQCDVEFSLEFLDEQGAYIDSEITGWKWHETNDGAVHEILVSFAEYAGRTLRLALVVRDNGDSTDDLVLWLHPQLWRVTNQQSP